MPTSVNYSRKQIQENQKNWEFVYAASQISTRSLNINLKLNINISSIHKQAIVFAHNYMSHGYVNHSRTLRIRQTDVFQQLYELYCYDLVKCYHAICFFENLRQGVDLSYSLGGNVAFFELVRSRTCEGSSGNMMQSYSIDVGSDTEIYGNFVRLFNAFPFLNKVDLMSGSFSNTPFIIPQYQNYFGCLYNDYYSRGYMNKNTGNSGGNTNPSTTSDSGEEVKVKSSSQHKDGADMSIGRLELLILGADSNSITKFENTPLFNSFLSSDGSSFYFQPVGNSKDVEFNPSFIFGKSYSFSLTSNNEMERINQLYKKVKLTSKQEHFVCSEVHCVTGIKCRPVIDNGKVTAPTSGYSVDDIIKKIGEIDYSKFVKIAEQLLAKSKEAIDLIENIEDALGIQRSKKEA